MYKGDSRLGGEVELEEGEEREEGHSYSPVCTDPTMRQRGILGSRCGGLLFLCTVKSDLAYSHPNRAFKLGKELKNWSSEP